MDIRQLRYFAEICRTGSFAQAAGNCFITAQGLSMSVARLENELGVKLFHRTPKGLTPTEEGEYLLPKAEMIIRIAGECEVHFAERTEGRKLLSLMFVRGTVEKFAQDSIMRFKRKFPDFTVRMQVGVDSDCDEAVDSGEAELAVCAGPVNTQKFEASLLYSDKNVLVVNKNRNLAAKELISVADLRGLPLALPQKATRASATLYSLCRREGFEPHVFAYNDDYRSAAYLADIDQSCGVMNMVSAKKLRTDNLRLIPFEAPELAWNVYIIRKKGVRLSPEARAYEKMLLSSK